ncbi:MAG: sensor domain-containing diguanylate cyclase [Planctomycetes bacterium]|nr:sensor domain-containing diguanylate cyclase [Planctomycetota bacterium]MBM4079758.1 sensor domain-containing diguanylate cyclase [Planctomycetota bacterium]MBM4087028.1 sensor domain-containing diguanylate cyclase [Planctomycetota bacterium]
MAIPTGNDVQRLREQTERLKELCRLSMRLQQDTPHALRTILGEATRILGAEMGMVNLAQHHELVFKECHNVPAKLASLSRMERHHTFCTVPIETGKPLVVRDARAEERFRSIALVTSFGIVSYLGVPLASPSGAVQGTLCVLGTAPRDFDDADVDFLTILAERAGVDVERESYIRELSMLKEKFERLSIMDELTGIYNRRYLKERLDKEFKRAKRYGSPLSFAMLDVDHFKLINDEHGPAFGDLVLKEIALILRSSTRDVDMIARYGGEEFAILLPETAGEHALVAAGRVQKNIQTHLFGDERHPVRLTASVGVSSYPADSVAHAQHLIEQADEALYKAKRQGPNGLVKF